MFIPKVNVKKDQKRRWNQPDRRFFACGACHILSHVYLEDFPEYGFKPFWIRPREGFLGNHVFVTDGVTVFDYHGYSLLETFLKHHKKRGEKYFPGWDGAVLPIEVSLISGAGHAFGLYIIQPEKFLHDPIPRARRFLKKFDHAGGLAGTRIDPVTDSLRESFPSQTS